MALPNAPAPAPISDVPDPASLGFGTALAVQANVPIYLVHYRNGVSWRVETVDGADVWVPELSPYLVQEGTNGFRTVDAGEEPGNKRARFDELLRKRGGVLIDPVEWITDTALLPAGAAQGPYLRSRAAKGGAFYYQVWDRPYPSATQPGQVSLRHDRPTYVRWLVSLVMRGVISPPSEDAIDALVSRAELRLQSTTSNASTENLAETRDRRIGKAEARLASHVNAERPWEPGYVAPWQRAAAKPAKTAKAAKQAPAPATAPETDAEAEQ